MTMTEATARSLTRCLWTFVVLLAACSSMAAQAPTVSPFDLGYYPYLQKVKLYLEVEPMPDGPVPATITGPNGEQVLGEEVTFDPYGQALLDVGELPEGRYTVRVRAGGEIFEEYFERKIFAWEQNGLGVTDRVYPPFTPIRVNGRTLSVVMREYEHGWLVL